MIRSARLRLAGLLLVLATATTLAQDSASLRYSFDDSLTASGPDTFQIFEHSSGSVELSSVYRFSGYRSVRLMDAAGSKDFPELQGYYPLQKQGKVTFAFQILIANPQEELNIALAGPAHFNLAKDGIAFWLQVRDGYFFHMSDSIPKRLAPALPFVWYAVRAVYDIDQGRYDLLITDEYAEQPVVAVNGAANAANQPGSAVNMFSFIGDLADRSNVDFYVDDIAIDLASGKAPSMAAPGRRKLFIEYWRDVQKETREKPVCLPALSIADLGLELADIEREQRARVLDLLGKRPGEGRDAFTDGRAAAVHGVVLWHRGCFALAKDRYDEARKLFDQAARQLPDSRLIQLSKVLALAGLKRWDNVDSELALIYPLWWGDERWVAAQGMIAIRRQDYPSAADLLAPFADGESRSWLGESMDSANVERLRTELPNGWWNVLRTRLLIEQRFYLYVWQNDLAGAAAFAASMRARIASTNQWSGLWWEWEGNVYLLMNDLEQALNRYQSAIKENRAFGRISTSVAMKLADVYFLKGDAAQEKIFREMVYGTLD